MPGITQKLGTFSATTGTLLGELNHLSVTAAMSTSRGLAVRTAADRHRHPARPHHRLLRARAQRRYPQPGPLHPDPLVHPHLRGRLVAPSPVRSRTGPASIWHRPAIPSRSRSPIESGRHAGDRDATSRDDAASRVHDVSAEAACAEFHKPLPRKRAAGVSPILVRTVRTSPPVGLVTPGSQARLTLWERIRSRSFEH